MYTCIHTDFQLNPLKYSDVLYVMMKNAECWCQMRQDEEEYKLII